MQKNKIKTLLNSICRTFKLQESLLLTPNSDVESVLKYWDIPYSIVSEDCEKGMCYQDNPYLDTFPKDFDLLVLSNYGSYLFRYKLLQYLSDANIKFIIFESGSMNFSSRKYNVIRFSHDAKEYKLLYLDVLLAELNSISFDPYEREYI